MKKFLFLLTATLVAMSMWAAPVDQATAQATAKNYLANKMYAGQIMGPAAVNPVLYKTETVAGQNKRMPVYYIYNTSTTFVVVAGEDRAEQILMVGDAPLVEGQPLPDAMQYLLDCYKKQIIYLYEHPEKRVDRPSDNPKLTAVTYGPLLTCNWDQDSPYNNLCKFTYNNKSYTCATGCPATSASMVMYYWKFPASVGAQASYNGYLDIGNGDMSYTFSGLEATTFDWNNMRDTYGYNSSSASKAAVATLMRYVGQAEHMNYGVNASGIYTTNAGIIATMFKNWGYKSTARKVNKYSYNETNWANLIIAEMAAGRPVVYLGVGDSGHAFNVDGYRDSDSKYHVNFGWSGYGNNWFAMNAFTDPWGETFNNDQMAIIGIESPGGLPNNPYFTVSPTSLTFTANTGETVTQTFTVSGGNLTENVTLSMSGNAAYTVSPTTLTPAQVSAGATVTVTYKPTAAGSSSAAIAVSYPNLTSQTVSITGTATAVTSLTANPNSLTFNTNVGTPVTQTFTLTGTNLPASYASLSVSGTGFSIDKTMVMRTALANGVVVTVTYNPSSSGTHTGTVNITCGSLSTSVTLNGTAVGVPTLNVNPTSLSFNTQPGTAVTKTFTVTGSDLTGNVSLAVSGTGFSIDKTTINKNSATEGATVTVTYNPTAGGTHTGTVTVTSAGAQSKTVTLNGTSTTTPVITVNPTSLSFNTVVGTPVTKTFALNGTYITGTVNIAVSGTGFAVDKSNVIASVANNGTTITVTYNPTAAGNHTGTVTLTSTGAQAVTVALSGVATEPVRTITANPTALSFNALVGETVTKTFTVTGENLNGPLTLAVNNGNGIYSIQPTTISVAEATAGKTVTVTYAPTAFGVTNASVTISGGGAPAATVNLAGQADLVKYAPVMLPANEEYINLTEFRADWTDETPAANVASYTLEVTPKEVAPVEPVLLHQLSGSAYNTNGYQDITLTAPWAGVSVRGGYGAIYIKNNYNGIAQGSITYTVPEGYTNATFTVKVVSANTDNGVSDLTVSTPQTAAISHNFVKNQTFYYVVTASSGEKITMISNDPSYSPDMTLIEVYSGDASAATLRAFETGDENGRVITGITDKFYTVENLAAAGTFLYRVKAIYLDGAESEWSNIEEVTLFENGHGYTLGDVNHDGFLTIKDVTDLINFLLTDDGEVVCPICADVSQDEAVSINDVTALINILLNGDVVAKGKTKR